MSRVRPWARAPFGAALLIVFLHSSPGFGHGVVGKRHFVEPIFVEDANPKNELVIGKFRQEDFREGGNAFHYDFVLEKMLSKRFSIALEGGWSSLNVAGEEGGSGFRDLGVLLKASLFESEAHEWRLSTALEVEIPTGSEEVGAGEHAALEPMILWAKGFGDLPANRLGMALRPFFVQGDAGLEVVISDHETDEDGWFTDVLVGYSLPYVHAWSPHRLPQPFAGLVPGVEFSFEGSLQGDARGTEAFVTPVLFWVGQYFEIGFGGRFRLNDHGETDNGALVGIIDLFLDDLVPASKRLLF